MIEENSWANEARGTTGLLPACVIKKNWGVARSAGVKHRATASEGRAHLMRRAATALRTRRSTAGACSHLVHRMRMASAPALTLVLPALGLTPPGVFMTCIMSAASDVVLAPVPYPSRRHVDVRRPGACHVWVFHRVFTPAPGRPQRLRSTTARCPADGGEGRTRTSRQVGFRVRGGGSTRWRAAPARGQPRAQRRPHLRAVLGDGRAAVVHMRTAMHRRAIWHHIICTREQLVLMHACSLMESTAVCVVVG